jgi:hypothetical protein
MLVLLARDDLAETCLALPLVHGCLLSSPIVACSSWCIAATKGGCVWVGGGEGGGYMVDVRAAQFRLLQRMWQFDVEGCGGWWNAVAADVGAASGCSAPSCNCWQHMCLGPYLGLNGLTWPLLCITFLVCCDVWCYPSIGRLAWKSDKGWLWQCRWMMDLGSGD